MPVSDAERLLLALKHEAQNAFCDLQGRQQRFSAFARSELGRLAGIAPTPEAQQRFADLEREYGNYPNLGVAERQELASRIRSAVPLLAEVQRGPTSNGGSSGNQRKPAAVSRGTGEGQLPLSARAGVETPPAGADLLRIKGIGSHLARQLAGMGLETVDKLLAHFPRTYLDYQRRTLIKDLEPGQLVTIWGTIRRAEAFTPPRRPTMSINTVWIADGTGTVSARWFLGRSSRAQQEAWKKRFPPDHRILLSGVVKVDSYGGRLTFDRPECEVLGPDAAPDRGEDDDAGGLNVGRIVPVYPLTEGIGQRTLRRAIFAALEQEKARIHDPLDAELRRAHRLMERSEALCAIHFPDSTEQQQEARRRMVFEELFWLQLGLAFKRAARERAGDGLTLRTRPGGLVEQLLAALPFEPTRAQRRVFDEIRRDLEATEPMSRLVQGDVGSGKTVVALMALLLAIDNGYQGALMAPTEILAEQHFRTFKQLLAPLKIEVALLLGSQSRSERETYRKALRSGFCKIAVGTHALLSDDVAFERLGLVVVDEQHRFGVRQRALLRAKSVEAVETLTMTATPIPRTLALALYGDLDVSVIDELPPGRKPVTTRWQRGKAGRKEAWERVRGEVAAGRQAYVVFPLVEESEKIDLKAATEEMAALRDGPLAGLRLGLLHGQLPPAEKDAAIDAFRQRELDVLVATTVIEVGVDVPNATVMVIENAERFGLSQLHQLRGRVGRGAEESHCILLSDGSGEVAKARLEVMCATQDGFVIAQKDLELRGPGEFIGTRQSGLPDLVLADLASDTRLLEEARQAAYAVVAADPELAAHPALKAAMLAAYRDNLAFLGIG